MLNQIILVGRVVSITTPTNKTLLKIAIPRSFKNADGEYESDLIDITLYNTIAQTSADYLKQGDLIGIKGRLQNTPDNNHTIIADKITFLSTQQETQQETTQNNNLEEGEI